MHVVVYTVSGHSHTLDMARIHEHSIRDSTCSMRISRDDTSIVAALHPVEVPSGVRTPLVKTKSYSVTPLFHIPCFIASD